MNRKYPIEQIEWIKANARNYSGSSELLKDFNQLFNTCLSKEKLRIIFSDNKLKYNLFRYQKEHIIWLKENINGKSFDELAILFRMKFNREISAQALTVAANKRGIYNNRDCKLKPGAIIPIGKVVKRKHGYFYKIKHDVNRKDNSIFIPKDVAINNELVPNCALAYGTIRLLEKEVK